MPSYNRIILMGHLTRDPQLAYLPSNVPVVEFGIATNSKYKDSNGTQRENVCFCDCKAFGKNAETLNEYMKKGMPLLIEGKLKQDAWTAQDNTKRSKHWVFIERFTFIPQGERKTEPSMPLAENAAEQAPSGSEDIPF